MIYFKNEKLSKKEQIELKHAFNLTFKTFKNLSFQKKKWFISSLEETAKDIEVEKKDRIFSYKLAELLVNSFNKELEKRKLNLVA